MNIGVLGATGPAGRGLAARLASVGHDVIAGSREESRAEAVVGELRDEWGPRVDTLRAADNAGAATADVVVVATTWEGAVATAAEHAGALAGKTVIAMANGLEKVGREFHPVLPEGRSLSEAVQAAAPAAHVVAAFQHVPAAAFAALDQPIESDIIVCSDHEPSRELVLGLVAGIPDLRAFDGGSLVNAIGIETFAAVLLTCNIRHKGKGTLRMLGLEGYQA
ncbi:MAG: NADPH-dependent F420 reductase [Actinobacteria bacterium]|nr:NADPH-dependent F420 reductase [Actinomycetota bacterium]